MIVFFAVTNFRSIRDRVVLDMRTANIGGHSSNIISIKRGHKYLKSAVVYGPNASGKSVLLLTMRALHYLVVQSSGFKMNAKIGPYEPFKLNNTHVHVPVTLEIGFFANKVYYEFLVSFNENQVIREELYFSPKGVKSLLYLRGADKEVKFGEYYRGGKKNIEKLVQNNQLFLSKAAENNPDSLKDPYLFLSEKLVVFPFLEDYHENNLSRLFIKRLAETQDSSFARKFNKLICALDTGISKIQAEQVDWEKIRIAENIPDGVKQRLKEEYKYDVKTIHPVFEDNEFVGEVSFKLNEESMGTRSLFVIGGIIIDVLEAGSTLILDEMEKNLHPEVTRYLIRLFHNPITNPNNAQLIFATHDITQLSGDTFRRDQIWFTEKDEYGVTSLYRCSDIKGLRLSTPLDKWYAGGKLGATPIINDSEFLIEMQINENG